jgi:hypothetical protein
MARLFLLISLLLSGFTAAAHENHDHGSGPERGDSVPLDLPVVDAPFNFLDGDGYLFPSMRQSLEISTGFYQTVHRAIGGDKLHEQRWRVWPIAAFDVFTTWTPLGSTWLHEEWHRATMSRRGIASYNDVNRFPFGASTIAVSHVTDDDLVRFKRDHPAEHARMSAAGMESQIAQNLHFERRRFFDETSTFDSVVLYMNNINVFFYLRTCGSKEADDSTDQQNEDDWGNVSKRDFTGLDCTAWVYDLFRPDEPYTARGVHPSGVGIDRYIRYSDLDGREKVFLKRQASLSLLNFADPFLYGFNGWKFHAFGREWTWNARLSHFFTSFGYTVDANLFLKSKERKFLFTIHNGTNNETYFPGVSAEWIDHPLSERWKVSTGFTLWNQPRNQRVLAKGGEMLASANAKLKFEFSRVVEPFIGVEAKTPGWKAGDVFLERNVSVWTGLRANLF